MEKVNKNVETFDEIVFENRNKDYGAYYLRNIYKKNTTIAVIIGMTVLLFIAGTPFIMASFNHNRNVFIHDPSYVEFINVKNPNDVPPPPPPPPPPPTPLPNIVKFTAPVVVDSVVEKVEISITDDQFKSTVNPNIDDNIPVDKGKITIIDEKPVEPEIYFSVEEMPEFPGGEKELLKFIASNIKYPEIAKENGVQGRVFVQFVVNSDGAVEKVEIKRGIDTYLDKEAIRVVQSMPKWTPGKQSGIPVKVQFVVPINFILQ